MPHVVLQQVSKAFRAPDGQAIQALKDFSLEVEKGELLTVVGPSGCGKTTTLRLMAGLEQPDAGRILIGGVDAMPLPPEERGVAMVFQSLALFPHFTVRENLASGLRWRKVGRAETELRVAETAARFGLADCLDRLPETLSGGQRQRVALGRALILRPSVLLLDEPLSNLDAPLRTELRRELAALNRETGMTVIYVTHDQAEAMVIGCRIAVMDGGRLQQVAAPMKIYHEPANRFVAEFFGTPRINLIPGILTGEPGMPIFQVSGPAGRVPPALKLSDDPSSARFPIGSKVLLGIRPEDVRLGEAGDEAKSVGEATITGWENLGAEMHVQLEWCGFPLTARTKGGFKYPAGTPTQVGFALERTVLLAARPE